MFCSKLAKIRKGKTPAGRRPKQHKVTFWTKESICLRFTDQLKAPDTKEKMKLAQMGLGFKEIKFDTEGGITLPFSVPTQSLGFVGGIV